MNVITRRAAMLAATSVISIGAAVAGSSAASANDDDVIREGSCSGATDWKVKASPEDGRIEFEGEIDSNRGGQQWSWRLFHNGEVTSRGTGTTGGRSGSFEVRRVVVNVRGSDTFSFRARNLGSGETCKGNLRF